MHPNIYHHIQKRKSLNPNLKDVNWFYTIRVRKNEAELKNSAINGLRLIEYELNVEEKL